MPSATDNLTYDLKVIGLTPVNQTVIWHDEQMLIGRDEIVGFVFIQSVCSTEECRYSNTSSLYCVESAAFSRLKLLKAIASLPIAPNFIELLKGKVHVW